MVAWAQDEVFDFPAYSPADASRYLRLKYTTLMYWIRGRLRGHSYARPLIRLASNDSPELSFANLLECHMLKALTRRYNIRLPKVRRTLETFQRDWAARSGDPHPLLDSRLGTDGLQLLLAVSANEVVSMSEGGQLVIKGVVEMFMRRIVADADGLVKYYPFVTKEVPDEPKIISISPAIASGRPVIDGTTIATAVVAARFNARDSCEDLALEYERTPKEIEEAVRWESSYRLSAEAIGNSVS